jgi:hypothetical protein
VWFEILLATLRDLCIFGAVGRSVVGMFDGFDPVILTIRQRENENLEFHRRGRCRPQTGPSWGLRLHLRQPWLCDTFKVQVDFMCCCSSGALHALKTARCSRLAGNEISRHVLEPQRNTSPPKRLFVLTNSHSTDT